MESEVIGGAWRPLTRKIGRRTDNDHLHGPHHPNRPRVRGAPFPWSESGIESLGHDIDRSLIRPKLEIDFGVGRQETSPDRHDYPRSREMARIDPQPSERPLTL